MSVFTRKYLTFSKYQVGIVILYVLLLPFFAIFLRSAPRYNFTREPLGTAVIISASALVILLVVLFWKRGRPGLDPPRVFWAIVYGAVFAVPEEIIFRGMVQGFLQAHFVDDWLPVLFASVIFGAAHLPNGSKGLHPRDWNWRFAGLTFAAGVPLGAIFALTDSLLVPTMLHAAFVTCLQIFHEQEPVEMLGREK